jgi:teichuronic acid biosynthesis glycosyltransferase TuaH
VSGHSQDRGGARRRPFIVLASGVSWDDGGRAGTERHLATHLTRYADVMWVDPPVSCLTRTRPGDAIIDSRRRLFRPRLIALSPTMCRLRAVGPPGLGRPELSSITWPIVRAQIEWALRCAARRPDVFVACNSNDLLGRWGANVVNVLYGTDDWVAGANLFNQDPRRILAEERNAIGRADLVLAVSSQLADRWRALGADPVVFPNGCDPEAYADIPHIEPARVPDGFPTPVAGMVGLLTDRIDVDLLTAVADAGLGLLLVGRRAPNWSAPQVEALLARQNVHHVGGVPFEALPRWLARIDVGLTAYADSAFNRASFPLKTLEYLAAGLPVVSTDLPASRMLRQETDQLWIAAGRNAFAAAVCEAARSPNGPKVASERRAVAARHSWTARADEFVRLVGLRA